MDSSATPERRAWDLDDVCDRIAAGETYTSIAADYGKTQGALSLWLAADPNRSARAKASGACAARAWDEQAEQGIKDAADRFELDKAREHAHHLRWRAAKLSSDYADRRKFEVEAKSGFALTITEALPGEAIPPTPTTTGKHDDER